MDPVLDLAVIGAGAAGLMAAISGARAARESGRSIRVVALDGARTLGAKILVAGGGRCNVTHHAVDESAYAGSTPGAIRKVLRAFDVARTVAFFRELGVELKREETGKLFPVTDDARTVLDALLRECRRLGIEVRYPWRVGSVRAEGDRFVIESASGADPVRARRVVLATGGRSLPRSGSDGHGYAIARALGHSTTERILPALVPLVVRDGHFVRSLSGVTLPATVEVRSATGKRLAAFTNSTLCTHFGLSGPSVLDASRYYLHARLDDPGAALVINWLPGESFESIDAVLQNLGPRTVLGVLRDRLPERLARALCESAGVDPSTRGASLARGPRRALAHGVTGCVIPIDSDRGYTYAEVTAGGVPLDELDLATMESRVRPGLHLAGEICDVDGRIGGFNFQWAWAGGFVAGRGAAAPSPAG
ncbi:MAG TPA: aminoacetone oxidase family FAD-binding enzyme [Phycisphaerales bacterium]|nr:aminoacetone oxidase family FAD-binding enzyme [Phycisphaerales bacterium]